MESGSPILNNLFNGLSSIYRTDDGMVNSNMFTILDAEAEVFDDIQRKINLVNDNTYIATASPDALEANFGVLVGFPKPPRLNTLTNGDEIYRAMLKSLFRVFQSGATTGSMDQSLSTAISFLTTDPNTNQIERVINHTHLFVVDSGIKLTWPAVHASGNNVNGPALASDIVFFPNDLIVTGYDSQNQTIAFTGNANTGTNYSIIYNRDNRPYNGSNWINLTNPNEVNVSPFDLKSQPIQTYDNPLFSYWWNTFNADGDGVVIDQFAISGTESSLAWRLPEKTIEFVSPYSSNTLTRTIEFYNESGTAYNIEQVDNVNRDIFFSDIPLNYYTDVSPNFANYYIRYSANNNGPSVALTQFLGSLPKFTKRYSSIEFPSSNFGQLDFFEKNGNFSVNDLFGTGTTNIWLNVPNVNGIYALSNDFLFQRQFSLHENILYTENFESGKLNRISTTNSTGTRISDVVGVPSFQKEDCLMLMGLTSGTSISVSPILTNDIVSVANHVEVDVFDSLNSGTKTLVDIVRTGNSGQYNKFRFGIDDDLLNFEFSALDPLAASKNFGFVETYFENANSTDRTMRVQNVLSPTTFKSYNFATGTNPNVLFSTISMVPSGGFVNVTPNASSSIISNANKASIQYNDASTVNGALTFTMSNYRLLGTGLITNLPYYGSETFSMISHAGFWNWSATTVSLFNPVNETTTLSTNGGITNIPYTTGTHVLEILKGTGVSIDGAVYTGSSFQNLGITWSGLGVGTGPGLANVSVGDINSFKVTANSSISFFHYDFENQSLKTNFNNTLNQYSGVSSAAIPYFYQIFNDPNATEAPKVYLNQFPRTYGWNTLKVDFGTTYTGTTAGINEVQFLNTMIPFSGNLLATSGVSLSTETNYPLSEFSYFDNILASYYDASMVLPQYELSINLLNDWEGSALSESTIIDNKFFELEPQPNFQFNVFIKGLDPSFIFIINKIIDKLKPAHTIATSVFESDQSLDTTALVPIVSSTGTDWETGNIFNNIIIKATGQAIAPANDLPGFISISGN